MRSHPFAAWWGGALVGAVIGLLLVSWLPLLLKAGGLVVIALALNLPGTVSSGRLQAGFLTSAGGLAFSVLMLNGILTGPIALLSVLALALGFVRTLQLADIASA